MTTLSPNTVAEIGTPSRTDNHHADFDALFRTHQPRLVDALTLVAGDREVAADAVQEAFVKAHLRWRRVGGYEDPIGWVRRVAINRMRDEHRRRRRKRRAIDRMAAEPARDAEFHLADDELTKQLALLPRRQRLCVVLHYVEDLGIAEIARTLDVSEGTVKSNLSDARHRLRSSLGARPAPAGPPTPTVGGRAPAGPPTSGPPSTTTTTPTERSAQHPPETTT